MGSVTSDTERLSSTRSNKKKQPAGLRERSVTSDTERLLSTRRVPLDECEESLVPHNGHVALVVCKRCEVLQQAFDYRAGQRVLLVEESLTAAERNGRDRWVPWEENATLYEQLGACLAPYVHQI